MALGLVLALAPAARAEVATLKLRIAWGGGADRVWQGVVGLSAGTLSQLETLGIEADEPGSIWLEGTQIRIRQPSPRAYDGIDVLVTAELDARLTIWLSNDQAETAKTVEIALGDLVNAPHNSVLDDVGNRLFVARAPGDRVRIEFDREHLVFAPGETFAFQVRPYLVDSTAPLQLQARITTHPGGARVWSQDYATGDAGTATSISLPVPQHEGVYELTIVAAQPSVIKKRLRLPQKPVAERKIQFVVLDTRPAEPTGEAPTSRVLEINPVNPGWWERFANLSGFPGFGKGPLGNGDAAAWDHPTLGPMIQLGPGGTAPNISWEAYPLPIDHPGQVHILEIEYPSDVPQTLGLSLLEPNAAGAVMPIGLDSGVYVSDEEAENPPVMARHRVVFWPKTKTPLLLVTNRRDGSRAVYGKITVKTTPHSQFSMLTLGRSDDRSALPPAFPNSQPPERLWAGYLDRPLVPENFGAPEALDGQSYRSLDDWSTFYQSGLRLANYLKYVGYNGLMLSVLADGSTIYPSRLLSPTPRYDTGVFFASGQDPRRKDALELWLRIFQREGLTLIPALQFAAPLPELEALKRGGGPDAVGIEWIGADGKPWLATGAARQGLAPYYNLLDPRVQQAMLNVAGEVLSRYGDHPAFGGLALQLTPEGYAQLPGADWGFDDRTIARFQQETGTQVPGAGPQRFAQRAEYLRSTGREAWLNWRASVVADFHRRLAAEIVARKPAGRLYLAGGTMLEDRQTQDRLRPALPRRVKLDETIKELGLSLPAYADESQIVMLRPQLLRPSVGPLPAQAAEREIYLSGEMDRLFAGAGRASLFYHEPQKARLASFDVNSPFGAASTYTWLVSELSPSGELNRRRFVHALATADAAQFFDGGWLLPLGQEGVLTDLLSVYRQLPAGTFETVPGENQPVTIRTLAHEGRTIVYLVNDSPWSLTVSLQVDAPPDATLEKIGASPGVEPLVRSGALTTWTVSLRPYDLVGARLSSPQAKLQNPVVTVPIEVRQALQRKIEDLVARVAASEHPPPVGVLENPGFELPLADNQLAGWTTVAPAGGRVALDSRYKHSGDKSLLLGSAGQPVSIVSAPFEPPGTGRLAVEVRLRAGDPRQPPSLRIAVEGEMREGLFEAYGFIKQVGRTAPVSGGWAHYNFVIDNVPAEGLSNLRVRLELMGPGEVWVDDVRVFDVWFRAEERVELSKIVSVASVLLEKKQFGDCARLLDGYWPHFLLAHVPLTTANTPVARRPANPQPPAADPKKPSMFDSVKEYFR